MRKPPAPKTFKERVRGWIQATGFDLVRIPEDDPRYGGPSYDASRPLPPGAAERLRADHPRLLELRERYSKVKLPMAAQTMWGGDYLREDLTLQYFRGDNAYVWQFRNVGAHAREKYFFFLRELDARDELGLLDVLKEDGLFGCWTFEYEGWPRVSRDLLDSINELYFLEQHLELLSRPGLNVLDIGAGYGRLAWRGLAASKGLGDWLCVDAVPESTFLCEYHLGFRECGPRAQVIPLDELDAKLQGKRIDVALNIHSFSETSTASITGWLSRLADLKVPALLVVPNDADQLLTVEPDGTRKPFDALFAQHGYKLELKQPVFPDPTFRDFMGVRDHFFLFRRG